MTIAEEFLALLRCPETQQTLSLADEETVAAMNQAIAAGNVRNRAGEIVEEAIGGALLRQDGAMAYPIVDEIPILLEDEAIPLDHIPAVSGKVDDTSPT